MLPESRCMPNTSSGRSRYGSHGYTQPAQDRMFDFPQKPAAQQLRIVQQLARRTDRRDRNAPDTAVTAPLYPCRRATLPVAW